MFGTKIEVSFREELDTTLPTEPYLEDTNDGDKAGDDKDE